MTFDWPTIRARYEAGESPGAISKSLGGSPTRQAIYQHKDAEGWTRQEMVVDTIDSQELIPVDESLSHEQRQVVEKVSQGWTQKMAADFVGVHENTIGNWKKNSAFVTALQCARAVKSYNRIAKIEAAPDWRAALALLERDPDSKGEFAPASQQSGGFQGNTFNVLGRLSLGIERSVESIEQTKKEQG